MRKTTSILLLLPLACALFSTSGFSQTEMVVSTSGGQAVPVYENNAITSTVIANLSNGEVVNALESRFGWTMIRTSDDKLGYIESTALVSKGTTLAPPAATEAQTQQSTEGQELSTAATASPETTPSRVSMKPTNNPKKPFPAGAAFYIKDMDDDLDGFLRAEIMKEKLPINLILSPELADFIITGASQEESKRSWHEGWLTASRDHEVGNTTAVYRESNEIVWASEAADRSL